MTHGSILPSYVVVTPVRDEERFIGDTLASMLSQTHKPLRWVIVDDGSTDRTPEILRAGTAGLNWVTVVSTNSKRRHLGSAEVLAFERGLHEIAPELPYAYVVKLDGDLRLPIDYFQRLLTRMSMRERCGIASGVYCEDTGSGWLPVRMPPYHAAGASKTVRRECFEAIGGFVARKGWDTVDEIRAGLLGWRPATSTTSASSTSSPKAWPWERCELIGFTVRSTTRPAAELCSCSPRWCTAWRTGAPCCWVDWRCCGATWRRGWHGNPGSSAPRRHATTDRC